MQDLSLHILDVAENSVQAHARRVAIRVEEDSRRDVFILEIQDDGEGMDEETKRNVLDPFFTTRTTRRVGLGLPLLAQAAREADGSLSVDSAPGRGTRVTAVFRRSHIDRKPLGDIVQTLAALILGNSGTDFVYRQAVDGRSFTFDTREFRAELEDVPLGSPAAIELIRKKLREGLASLRSTT